MTLKLRIHRLAPALGAAGVLVMALVGCAPLATPTPPVASLATPAQLTTSAWPDSVRRVLAPTGVLRIGVYPGSPTSLVENVPPEQMRGVSVDIGRLLAQRLGVPAQVVVKPRVAEVVAALQRGELDFTITNATAERARLVDFAPALVDLELGVLVPQGSRLTSVDELDQAGLWVGVSQGSSSERVLGGRLKRAQLKTYPSLDAVQAALQAGEIGAFATNKGILFELADRVAGARVLDGRWGAEHLAPAVPKGREAAQEFLRQFGQDLRERGDLARAVQRAGLRGTVPAP